LRDLRGIDQVNLAPFVFDVKFSTAWQEPAIIMVMDFHSRAIGDMHRERAKRLGAEAVSDFINKHGEKLAGEFSKDKADGGKKITM